MKDPVARQQEIQAQEPRIAPLAIEEVSEVAKGITDRLRAAAGGTEAAVELPDIVGIMLKHPDLYLKHHAITLQLLGSGKLSPRHRELAILRVAWLGGAPWEWGVHVPIAKRAGVTSDEIERLTQGSTDPAWDLEDRAIVRAVEELKGDAMISDATWSDLSTFLDEQQLIELIYMIGTYTKSGYLLNSFRVRLPNGNVGLATR